MEVVSINDENSFNPTPRLKSSPIKIEFISFDEYDTNCIYCGEKYIKTLLCSGQRYCKNCLSRYISDIADNDITDDNTYLDVYIYTMDLECNEHKINRKKVPQSIQECCRNCLRILYFKQIRNYGFGYCQDSTQYHKVIESEKYCKLCGKLLYLGTDSWSIRTTWEHRLCSDCYLISSGWIESTLVKKQISILYLPLWYNNGFCVLCDSKLKFASDCQKHCTYCLVVYVGCRYCLTTNIIFGPACQSQCKKCKRISLINIDFDFDDFVFNNITYDSLNKLKVAKFAKTIKKFDKYFESTRILRPIFNKGYSFKAIKWIPYSQFKDVEEITKGGYGIIYKATWLNKNETVILKRFDNSKNDSKYFLSELNSIQHCFFGYDSHIIGTYGLTKDPKLEDYVIVMKYASEGDLHKYLQKNFTKITWNKQKPLILWQISEGLENIHKKKFMHRDFHSGNILFDSHNDRYLKNYQWKIGDLGLSQAANNKSSNNEIYGVIPYIAPEIFKGSKFTKEADIYSLGMIMWELTTGCKPFANVKHDIHLVYKILDGVRPKITEDTPECYANLMKSCWDLDPKKRPSIKEIRLTFGVWAFRGKNVLEFYKAEDKRMELIESKKIGPEFAEKQHSDAIYTSRPLSAIISSISSCSTISSDSKYITLHADIKSLSTIRNSSTSHYISTEFELDINTESSTIQKFSTSSKRKNNVVLLDIESRDNNGKRIKTNYPYNCSS
ncbi:hypothetical protein RclHR1_05550006 [Rhizophagus clarus]|uniref:Kinase-like domain-containing protein n=1 Tax=Rhizophagus clarus TaxID=94130 RepID=A0A2Z6SFZ9_9GLOM|nr:hypothetical protein RclHR1_05550006 [Rhizophagus clarus]GES93600.1 kinase-like domain-containing protein [Rhizophagus clarus]